MSRKFVCLVAAAGLAVQAFAFAAEEPHVRVTLSMDGPVLGGDHVLDVIGQKVVSIHDEAPAPYNKSFPGSAKPILVNAKASYMIDAAVQYRPEVTDYTDPKGDHAFYRGPMLLVHGYIAADQLKPEAERTTTDYLNDLRISSDAYDIALSEAKPKYEKKLGPGVSMKVEWLNPEHMTRIPTTTYRPGEAPVSNP